MTDQSNEKLSVTMGGEVFERVDKEQEIRDALAAATPGPWEVVDIDYLHIAKGYRYENGKHIAKWIADVDSDEDNENQQSDAHLIANSPEWLQYLLDKGDAQQKSIYDAADEILTLRGAISEAITIWETMTLEDDPGDTMDRVIKKLR